jgi:beta-mannosidase
MRQVISLNGADWYGAQSGLRAPEVAEIERLAAQRFQATVPGEVRLDFLRAGLLKDDPFYGRNNDASRWVESQDWWYWRDFELELELASAHGWYCTAQITTPDLSQWRAVGRARRHVSRQRYDITKLLTRRNRVAVRFLAPARLSSRRSTPWEKFLNRWERRFIDASCDPDRRDWLKCQMSYGWDFAPELRTIGLWDDVELVVTGEVSLFDVQVKTRLASGRAVLTVSFDADALTAGGHLRLVAGGQTFEAIRDAFDSMMLPAPVTQTWKCRCATAPVVPWDHGEQNLYSLTVKLNAMGTFDR